MQYEREKDLKRREQSPKLYEPDTRMNEEPLYCLTKNKAKGQWIAEKIYIPLRRLETLPAHSKYYSFASTEDPPEA